MQNVLLPIDGSDSALRAVALCIAGLSEYRAPERIVLHLVNVQPSLPQHIKRFANHAQIDAFQQDEAEKALAGARQLVEQAGVRYASYVKIGNVAEEIVHLAEALGCDQIVMGTRGQSVPSGLLMGSIALKVMHLTQLPLLLVK